jgi:3-carboxy-cis,cis-muconate cycloisomerase
MADLFWPGDERAGELMSETALLEAMVRVESAWLDALVDTGLAPASGDIDLTGVVTSDDVEAIARAAESGGNPVIPVVELLRSRVDAEAARWLHRVLGEGATHHGGGHVPLGQDRHGDDL